jgi:hypothetical protein
MELINQIQFSKQNQSVIRPLTALVIGCNITDIAVSPCFFEVSIVGTDIRWPTIRAM